MARELDASASSSLRGFGGGIRSIVSGARDPDTWRSAILVALPRSTASSVRCSCAVVVRARAPPVRARARTRPRPGPRWRRGTCGCHRRHAETIHRIVSATPFTLQRQAGPDGGITVVGLATALSGRVGLPDHLGVEPDRQRTPAPARLRHWSRTHGDTMAHCRPASSRSCRSGAWVCS